MSAKKHVVITGAGPVGCLAAEVFASRSFNVDIYEKRPAAGAVTEGGHRTVNLSLNPRGMRALDRVGLGAAVRGASVPMVARAFHSPRGEVRIQTYGRPEWQTYSITREELSSQLLGLVRRRPNVSVHFGYTCLDVDLKRRVLTMRGPDNGLISVEADLIVGADGVTSTVRSSLLRVPRINFTKTVSPGGYRELTLRGNDGDFPFCGNAIHIWPRGNFFMVALPNRDGTLRGTLILPDKLVRELRTPEAMETFLTQYLPDILPYLAETPAELLRKPVGDMITVRCGQFHHSDAVLLLGDAAHAVVPFMGQGVNIGLEDCIVLAEVMEEHGQDLEKAFACVTRRRLSEALACADLSEWNLQELVSGTPTPTGPVSDSLVSRVNFSGLAYAAVAARVIPDWRPRVVTAIPALS